MIRLAEIDGALEKLGCRGAPEFYVGLLFSPVFADEAIAVRIGFK